MSEPRPPARNAATYRMALEMSDAVLGLGAGMSSSGTLFEAPSNIALERIGASRLLEPA